ncbi:MAG: DUF1656 domain-containing protein [Inquilinus sp.]|uniref:DUF1656 domain-containing protein n=1 Tax=Inquilinus sp. TaxID=1932117 RepID=UPI003F2D602F
MTHEFSELVVGGVFVSPFMAYAVASLAVFLALRPILRLIRFGQWFSHPAVAELSLYVAILGLLTMVL